MKEKRYYSITDVAKIINIQPSVLRYWEQFLPEIVTIKGNFKNRKYTRDNIELIQKMYNLVVIKGMRPNVAANILKSRKNVEKLNKITLLNNIKNELEEMIVNIDNLLI